jgi:hypothetical protein
MPLNFEVIGKEGEDIARGTVKRYEEFITRIDDFMTVIISETSVTDSDEELFLIESVESAHHDNEVQEVYAGKRHPKVVFYPSDFIELKAQWTPE